MNKLKGLEQKLMLALVSSSSSSSSDSSEECSDEEQVINATISITRQKPRVNGFVDTVIYNYNELQFRENLRLTRTTALMISEKFEDSRFYKKRIHGGGRKSLNAMSQCFLFLWFAGNKNSYREVANLFNVTISCAYKIISTFLEFLFELSTTYIKMPATEEEKYVLSEKFEKISGFPNVIGCMDGCYIPIRKPALKVRSTYINRHGATSITMQSICDADKKFLDVFVGSPSKIHDARIFRISFVSKKIPSICGDNYHLLGDAAYPLREYLLTPYKDYGSLNAQKRRYNLKHAQTRVLIENTFGILKQRFRQLMRLDFFKVEKMCKFVLGCCVLHNLCIQEGDMWPEEQQHPIQPPTLEPADSETLSALALQHKGELKRDRVAAGMCLQRS